MHQLSKAIENSFISQTEVCKAIGQSRSGLEKLKKKDPSFPKPIKFGTSRQACSYYVVGEINEWFDSKIKLRDTESA